MLFELSMIRKIIASPAFWVILGMALVFSTVGHAIWPFDKKGEENPPEIKVSEQPLSRDTKLTTSFSSVVKKVAPCVVTIYTTKTVKYDPRREQFLRYLFGDRAVPEGREQKQQGLGSGVIVTSDGYIITNNHVIEGVDEILVRMENEKHSELVAKVVGADPATDLAVLKVEAKGLPVATLGDSSQTEVGDIVLAVGNPFAVGQTVTMGIISAKGRQTPDQSLGDYQDFIQTDASINPGNSGGALVDAEGRVIAINTAIYGPGNIGIGFAIPVNMARDVMTQIINTGKVSRGMLGVEFQDVNLELSEQLKLGVTEGVLISRVLQGSAAEDAKLKRRDVISGFNGKTVLDGRTLRLMVSQTPPGQKVKVNAIRDGKPFEVEVVLKEAAANPRLLADPGEQEGSQAPSNVFNGVEVADVEPRLQQQFNIPKDAKGALIIKVDPNSDAAEADLKPGDLISEIDDQPVASAKDAIRISKKISKDRVLIFVIRNGQGRYVVVKDLRK